MRHSAVFIIAALMAGMPLLCGAQDAPTGDPAIDLKLHTLTQALDSQEESAEYWEYGWGGFDAGTMAYSAIQAVHDGNRKDRSTDIVQAGESLIGLADVVLRPLPAFHADTVCRDPTLTRQDVQRCLSAREALLERSAERANEPYELFPHLANFGFNLAAGILVSRVADMRHALITAIPGEIIGEAQLWSTPRGPIADKDKYQLQFGPLVQQTEGEHITETGVMATLKF